MDIFDMAVVKRETLEEFQHENSYLNQLMPYNNEVFDSHSVDWLSGLAEDRSMQYTNLEFDEDETLNRLNYFTVQQRQDELCTNHLSVYNESSPDLEHRLDSSSEELGIDIKSFYSPQHLYSHGLNTSETTIEIASEKVKNGLKPEYPVPCSEEDTLFLSDHLSDRDSESGYDSGAHSPTSENPMTPTRCLTMASSDIEGSHPVVADIPSPNDQTQNRQPFFLSDEEKRTLITEGLPIPEGYPLTKSEERALKKVRRKIKNKISAQESRRKKKEYMETLEKRVELCSKENLDLRKKLENMETANRTLINQLQKLQSMVTSKMSTTSSTTSSQTEEQTTS